MLKGSTCGDDAIAYHTHVAGPMFPSIPGLQPLNFIVI